jgi:uncharacterized metal-binding protein YceD (DUF177 family)
MKIEFRKVPLQPKEFEFEDNSVKILGTFCKISQRLVECDAKIKGVIKTSCYKCGSDFDYNCDEDVNFLVSNGITNIENEDKNLDQIIVEIEDGFIDFKEILDSEIESIKSEYYTCHNCNEDSIVNIEY